VLAAQKERPKQGSFALLERHERGLEWAPMIVTGVG
jgi:hypothetical protein